MGAMTYSDDCYNCGISDDIGDDFSDGNDGRNDLVILIMIAMTLVIMMMGVVTMVMSIMAAITLGMTTMMVMTLMIAMMVAMTLCLW